jgi:C1A family cysteine protease
MLSTRKIARFGYSPDLGDFRDHPYELSGNPIKDEVDLRSVMPAVWDQGQIGSCVWHAIPALLTHLHLDFMGSRLWGYYKTRVIEHSTKQDSGCQLRDAIKVLANLGFPPEAMWPYDISKFKKAPPRKANTAAKKEIIKEYQRLGARTVDGKSYSAIVLEDMLDCLSQGLPLALGFTVYDSFESDAVARTGIVPMPSPADGNPLGGHAVAVVGYKKINGKPYFIVRNSWSEGWGDKGHFYMPFEFFTNSDLASDIWMIKTCP